MMKLPLVFGMPSRPSTAPGALQWRCNPAAMGARRQRKTGEEGTCERDTRTARASSSATASRSPTRCSARASPRSCFAPTDPIVHSRAWKAQVPYLARTSGWSPIDPRGNGRSDRPSDRRLRRHRVRGRHARGAGRRSASTGRSSSGSAAARWTTLLARRPLHPDRVARRRDVATWAPLPDASDCPARGLRLRRPVPATDEGWAKDNPHTGAGLARIRRVLLRRAAARAALDQAVRGLRRLGAGDRRRDDRCCSRTRRSRRSGRSETEAVAGPGDAAPCWPSTATRIAASRRTRASWPQRRPGASCCSLRGRRAPAAGARPVVVNRAIRDFARPRLARRRGRRPGAIWTRPLTGRSGCSTCPRRSGSGTPGATSPSPTQLRELRPGVADRLAGPAPGHRAAAASAASGSTRRRPSWPASPAHIESESASTTCTPSRRSATMDEILVANFMVFDELVRERAVRPRGRRRGLGARLLPAREPRAASARRTPGSPTSSAGCRCRTAVRARRR